MANRDERLKKLIVDQLYWDDHVDVSNVAIEVSDGRVSLKGIVKDDTARQSAEAATVALDGIEAVENLLSVKHVMGRKKTSNDSEIYSHIVSEIRKKPQIDDSGIDVMVHEEVVTLKGTVEDYQQKVLAHSVADETRVRGIVNKLAVRSS